MRFKEIVEGLSYKGYPCTKDCSGHQAGDFWAAARDIQDPDQCPLGSSNSFWEGCRSHAEYEELDEESDSQELEEGIKNWIAGAALGAAALGAGAATVQTVKPGDTVYSIARANNVSPQEIMQLNGFNKDTKLSLGQQVKLPSKPSAAKKVTTPTTTTPTTTTPTTEPSTAAQTDPYAGYDNDPIAEILNARDREKLQEIQRRLADIKANNNKAAAEKPVAPVLPKTRREPPIKSLQKVLPQTDTYKPITGNPLEVQLYKFAKKSGLRGEELAAFMGQTAHESDYFRTTKEYSSGKQYEGRPDLGNKYAGDGTRYKGRGFIQITGRYHYTNAAKELKLDLVKHPELAERPDVAARVSLWYWKKFVRPNVQDFQNVQQVTRRINPALRGLEKRTTLTKDFATAERNKSNNKARR